MHVQFSRTHLSMGSRRAPRAYIRCACERCKGWSGSWSRRWPGQRSALSPCTRCYCPPTAATTQAKCMFINTRSPWDPHTHARTGIRNARADNKWSLAAARNARSRDGRKKYHNVAAGKVATWIQQLVSSVAYDIFIETRRIVVSVSCIHNGRRTMKIVNFSHIQIFSFRSKSSKTSVYFMAFASNLLFLMTYSFPFFSKPCIYIYISLFFLFFNAQYRESFLHNFQNNATEAKIWYIFLIICCDARYTFLKRRLLVLFPSSALPPSFF